MNEERQFGRNFQNVQRLTELETSMFVQKILAGKAASLICT